MGVRRTSGPDQQRLWPRVVLALSVVAACAALVVVIARDFTWDRNDAAHGQRPAGKLPPLMSFTRPLASGGKLTLWWGDVPKMLRDQSSPTGPESNIHPKDYTGPQACQKCHPRNYELWSTHPHRWMNAPADSTTILGDFSESAGVSYRGGQVRFRHAGAQFLMQLQRDGVERSYEITQTIGRRFFQYYVGRQLEGPEASGHPFYSDEHVLPFGYWLDRKEWVPVVHLGPEVADRNRPDPFDPPDHGPYYAEYASSCNYCHTTFPLGDLFGRRTFQMGEHAPAGLYFSMGSYLTETHPEIVPSMSELLLGGRVENPMLRWDAAHYAVGYGVSCEACHLGARAHVDSEGRTPPRFFPASSHLRVEGTQGPADGGRTHANVNWACGRCHTGGRPKFAAGMSTWNSVEYGDAMLGACYSKLRCIDCHEPHRETGKQWSHTAEQDDRLCMKCHDRFQNAEARKAHTHHADGSDGGRCMNCHMPRINEGLQDVVRTHMIFSPTRPDMIEANHPNACNLCHTDRSIDWTLDALARWYGKKFDETKIAASYADRRRPAALEWLQSKNASVRLVAAEALTRARDGAALPELLDALDDSHLVNRQFASKGVEAMLHVRLAEFGYRFYMTAEERRKPLQAIRAKLLDASAARAK